MTLAAITNQARQLAPSLTRLIGQSQLFPFHSAENWGNGRDKHSMDRRLVRAGLKPMVCCREYGFISMDVARPLLVDGVVSVPTRAPPYPGAKRGVCGSTVSAGDCASSQVPTPPPSQAPFVTHLPRGALPSTSRPLVTARGYACR